MSVERTEVEDQLHAKPTVDMMHELQDAETQIFHVDQEPNLKARIFINY